MTSDPTMNCITEHATHRNEHCAPRPCHDCGESGGPAGSEAQYDGARYLLGDAWRCATCHELAFFSAKE